jgi:hypothetical protein
VQLVPRHQRGREIVESFDRCAYGRDEPVHAPNVVEDGGFAVCGRVEPRMAERGSNVLGVRRLERGRRRGRIPGRGSRRDDA